MQNYNLQVLVINLDKSTERLAAMKKRLKRAKISWIRVQAIDGVKLNLNTHPGIDKKGYRLLHGKNLNPAEAGCYLSHLKAMREFIEGTCDFALILEDDADFPEKFYELLDRLISLKSSWDVVKLSSFHSGTPLQIAELIPPYALAVPLSRHMNANSVLFNRKAVETLVQKLLPMQLPYDHALERSWLYGLKLRIVTPAPCPSETNLASTIGNRIVLKTFKLPWYQRFPAMCFRLLTEISRLGVGLQQTIHERRK